MEKAPMKQRTATTWPALWGMALLLASCSTLDTGASRLKGIVSPYQVEVVQGNVVTREQLALLRPGLSRNQVREVLGTPLITSLFHAQRWDYAFTIQRQGAQPLQRHVSVFFEKDLVDRFEADELPSEAEFTARIDTKLKGNVKVPKLEASAEEIKPYLTRRTPEPNTGESGPARASYPPLEPQ
jgi:outer membrane protein assembly factor BamE